VVGIDGDSTPQASAVGEVADRGRHRALQRTGRLAASVDGVRGSPGCCWVYLLRLALWRSPGWAGLAGLPVAVDGVHVVQPAAMLDTFMSTFITGVVVLGGSVLLYGPWLVIPRTRFLF
jgi:hypothetical protein